MRRVLLFIPLLALLLGCNQPLQNPKPPSAFSSSKYYLNAAITIPKNLDEENCGAQALGAATASLKPPGIQFSPALLKDWRHDGATSPDMLIVARAAGYSAELAQSDWPALTKTVLSNQRAMVMFDSTIEVWTPFGWFRRPRSQSVYHWAAVAGFAKDGSALLLAAPGGGDYIIPYDSFTHRWSRADNCLITIAVAP